MQRLREHPRCQCGNFWHKQLYPNQIWLDGLYMAQPFYMAYEAKFDGMAHVADITRQFQNVRKYLYNPEKGLNYHAYDEARVQFWADKGNRLLKELLAALDGLVLDGAGGLHCTVLGAAL